MKEKVKQILLESIATKQAIAETQVDTIIAITNTIVESLQKGGKIILFGNGGSAADSQHIAAEFVGRFQKERQALAAIALTVNTSILTAIGNDYGYECVFSKQVEALAQKNDIVVGISTSGNAKNVIKGVAQAREMGITTIALTGVDGGSLAKQSDISLTVPSNSTARIQEAHITISHIICELTEEKLTGS
ncbi:SIS domain-containing protein [Candidatus Omnitrophota bacterium]